MHGKRRWSCTAWIDSSLQSRLRKRRAAHGLPADFLKFPPYLTQRDAVYYFKARSHFGLFFSQFLAVRSLKPGGIWLRIKTRKLAGAAFWVFW